jgi:hypothetical protein
MNRRSDVTTNRHKPRGRALYGRPWKHAGNLRTPRRRFHSRWARPGGIDGFGGPAAQRILRRLVDRAPQFGSGAANTLERVVEFYDGQSRIGPVPQDKAERVALRRAL